MAKEATFLRLGLAFESLKLRNMIIELLDLYCINSQNTRQEEHVSTVPAQGNPSRGIHCMRAVWSSVQEIAVNL